MLIKMKKPAALSEDPTFGTITIAEPIGIICGIVPTTNPLQPRF